MNTTTIDAVAIATIRQYAETGRALNTAYRAEVRRAAARSSEDFAHNLGRRQLSFLDASVKDSLIRANDQIIGLVADRLVSDSERVDLANQRSAELREANVNGLFDLISVAFPAPDAQIAEAVNAVVLPGAQASLSVAKALREGATALTQPIVDGGRVPVAAASVVAATPRRVRKAARA